LLVYDTIIHNYNTCRFAVLSRTRSTLGLSHSWHAYAGTYSDDGCSAQRNDERYSLCILLLYQSLQFLNTLEVLLQLLSHTRSDFIANSCVNIINCPGENNGYCRYNISRTSRTFRAATLTLKGGCHANAAVSKNCNIHPICSTRKFAFSQCVSVNNRRYCNVNHSTSMLIPPTFRTELDGLSVCS
jgi:hypothetical protein